MEQRTELRWTLEDMNAEFKHYIIGEALLIAGGCTIHFGQGYWIAGADVKQEMYHGETERDLIFVLEIICETGLAARTLNHMKAAIVFAAKEYNMDINWVHVTASPIQLCNFSITEDLVA